MVTHEYWIINDPVEPAASILYVNDMKQGAEGIGSASSTFMQSLLIISLVHTEHGSLALAPPVTTTTTTTQLQ